MSGYYSKDAIIEFAYLRGNSFGYFAAIIGIITAILTAVYSWRLIFKTFHGNYQNKNLKKESMHESPGIMLLPLFVLAAGSIFTGFLFKDLFIGHHSSELFWLESIKFLIPLSNDHPPFWIIYSTPVLVVLTIPISYYIFVINKNIPKWFMDENKPIYNFLINKWYFDELYNFLFVKPIKNVGIFFWKNIDINFIDRFGLRWIFKI